ncbi:peptidase [Planctomycetales bacterium]|nr:peptidase [Planctomycetales bacterium]
MMSAVSGLLTVGSVGQNSCAPVWAADAAAASNAVKNPDRKDVPVGDTWDLSSLFKSDDDWKAALDWTKKRLTEYKAFEGKLTNAENVLEYLRLDESVGKDAERIGVYAYLRGSEDVADAKAQEMQGLSSAFSSDYNEAASFVQPELLELDEAAWNGIVNDPALALYKLKLERLAKERPHTLSKPEEKILAQLTEIGGTASKAFNLLNNADLKFGTIVDETGKTVDLTTGSFVQLLQSPDRKVREKAFHQFQAGYKEHENTLGSLLSSSMKKDVIYAKVRKYPSALDAALFHSEVPRTVYENLVSTVNKHLPVLHRYYELRRKKMGIDDIRMYDTYIPILSDITVHYTWEQAVEIIAKALAPLGEEYVSVLTTGLTTARWCDRYENKGKRSGAFSYGIFSALPYISINYKPDVIASVFTLAHEGGHSMHSYYSAKNQPFVYYDYVTFVAEVASTFNEDMLSRYLLKTAADNKMKAWLINRQIDAIRNTLFRQTMFAEFEQLAHREIEADKPLSSSVLQGIYRKLLEAYFGPKFTLDDDLPVECLRVPHFYRAYYVYQYATSICASLELTQRVTEQPDQAANYIQFLSGGCSKTPIELLKAAGVDMESPQPIEAAMKRFESLVNELERLI